MTIEQAYLLATDGSEVRVRRRGQRGAYAYSHTIRKPTKDGQRIEVDRSISGREYVGLMGQRDPSRRVVSKERRCFAWEGQIFRLDRFASPRPGMLVLEAEVHDPSRPVALPPWLVVDRDVTDDKAYSNFALAAV
jgi:CYTH domain-containing protein